MKVRPKASVLGSTKLKGSINGALLRASIRNASPKREESQKSSVKVTIRRRGSLNSAGNNRGMHVHEKGNASAVMKEVRSKRRIYNSKMPVLACSNCAFSAQCPQYKAGYECAFIPFLHGHKISTESDVLHYAKELAAETVRRSQTMLMMENLTGGMPTSETSESLALAFSQLTTLYDKLHESTDTEVTVEGEATIIGGLFGNMDDLLQETSAAARNPIDVPTIALDDKQTSDLGDHALLKELRTAEENEKESTQALIPI